MKPSADEPFPGFPGIAQATAIPNVFFAVILPRLQEPCELLAFLWVSRLTQAQRGEPRFVNAGQVWNAEGAPASFEQLAGGRTTLDRGLDACARIGALLSLRLAGPGGEETVYFVNNPSSRRAVGRARAGELRLKPETIAIAPPAEDRPGIFRLYEENVGTITPLVGERLLEAVELYPQEWIEEAFRTAAEMNVRNWKYIERILKRWSEEGRGDEGAEGDSFEERKRRYLGGSPSPAYRSR
ncbi:MAG: DnaD domain protein [Dehalococcoidia bacterium]